MPVHAVRPRLVALGLPIALAVLLAALLAGCGGTQKRAAGGAVESGGAFPVRIDHKYGSTEIKARPKRVVTLGYSDQDAVLALGVRPVGVVDWFRERPYGKWPWAQPLWGGVQPAIVGERDDYKVVFMTSLGFTVPGAITKAVGKEYAAEIGSERLDLVDVDRLVFLTSDKAAEGYAKADKVYTGLKVARERRALFVPYETPPVGAAISFNTVLSIPYALDQMIPLLTAMPR